MNIDSPRLLRRYSEKSPGQWKATGFAKMPTRVLHDSRLAKADILVLLVLVSRTFSGKEVTFPSLTTIARESRYSRPAVIQAIHNLEQYGYVRVERSVKNSRKTNRYFLLDSCG